MQAFPSKYIASEENCEIIYIATTQSRKLLKDSKYSVLVSCRYFYIEFGFIRGRYRGYPKLIPSDGLKLFLQSLRLFYIAKNSKKILCKYVKTCFKTWI